MKSWFVRNKKALGQVAGTVIAGVAPFLVPGSHPTWLLALQVASEAIGAVAVAFQTNIASNVYAKFTVSGLATVVSLVIANFQGGGISRAGWTAVIGGFLGTLFTYLANDGQTPNAADVNNAAIAAGVVPDPQGVPDTPDTADPATDDTDPPPASTLPSVADDGAMAVENDGPNGVDPDEEADQTPVMDVGDDGEENDPADAEG